MYERAHDVLIQHHPHLFVSSVEEKQDITVHVGIAHAVVEVSGISLKSASPIGSKRAKTRLGTYSEMRTFIFLLIGRLMFSA